MLDDSIKFWDLFLLLSFHLYFSAFINVLGEKLNTYCECQMAAGDQDGYYTNMIVFKSSQTRYLDVYQMLFGYYAVTYLLT